MLKYENSSQQYLEMKKKTVKQRQVSVNLTVKVECTLSHLETSHFIWFPKTSSHICNSPLPFSRIFVCSGLSKLHSIPLRVWRNLRLNLQNNHPLSTYLFIRFPLQCLSLGCKCLLTAIHKTQRFFISDYEMYAGIVIYLAALKAQKLTGCEGIRFASHVALKA